MIYHSKNWLGVRMSLLTDDELCKMFGDIYSYHKTGILSDYSPIHELTKEFEKQAGDYDLRVVENAILYEISRRFYNQKLMQSG